MTNRSAEQLSFPGVKERRVETEFSGGNVTSDGGVLLLRQADRHVSFDVLGGAIVGRSAPQCELQSLGFEQSNSQAPILISICSGSWPIA